MCSGEVLSKICIYIAFFLLHDANESCGDASYISYTEGNDVKSNAIYVNLKCLYHGSLVVNIHTYVHTYMHRCLIIVLIKVGTDAYVLSNTVSTTPVGGNC